MTRAIRAVLFDLDGTILQTLESIAEGGNRLLDHYGRPRLAPPAFIPFIGHGAYVLVERIMKATGLWGEVAPEEAYAVYAEAFASCRTYRVRPFPGIVELLAALRRRGVACACVTNKTEGDAVAVIEAAFAPGTFDLVRGRRDGEAPKPDPASTVDVLVRLGVRAREACFVGDSEVDIQTGRNAGCITVAVTWGYGDRKKMASLRPDAWLSDAGQMVAWLD